MLVCLLDWTSLPFPFAFLQIVANDRFSASEAILRLIRKRWLVNHDRHLHVIADGAFSSLDTLHLLTQAAIATDGTGIDLTVSIPDPLSRRGYSAMSHALNRNEYRVFYSPITEATVLLFKVHTRGKDHLIVRWSNAYKDPRSSSPNRRDGHVSLVPAPARYSVEAAKNLLKWPLRDLITLSADVGRFSGSKNPYQLVHNITGVDLVQMQCEEKKTKDSDQRIRITDSLSVTREFLQNSSVSFLIALCKKYSLCSTSKKMRKDHLIKRIELSSKMTIKQQANIRSRFTTSSIFDGGSKNKEKELPELAAIYKSKFNWQDRFDRFLSSIDIKIRCCHKIARLNEIYFLIALVVAWSHYAELMVISRYPTRLAYRKACLVDKSCAAIAAFPLKGFLKELRKDFADSSHWLPSRLKKIDEREYN